MVEIKIIASNIKLALNLKVKKNHPQLFR